MQVDFKFSVGQRITTPFGADGIVSTCAVDEGGKNYYVKTAAGGEWFREEQLSS